MVQVSYPGVYIDEVASGVHTIVGVSTSIGAFFGRASKGPMNKPVRLTGPADFTRNFGAPHPLSDLAASVSQFFDNGGSDCYVVRLAAGAAKANVTLQNLGHVNVLIATAKNEGDFGNYIRLEIDHGTDNPDESFNLRVIEEDVAGNVVGNPEYHTTLVMDPQSSRFAPDFVTQSSDLIDLALDPALVVPITLLVNTPAGFSQSRYVMDFAAANIAATRTAIRNICNPAGGAPALFSISVDGEAYHDVDITGFDPTVGPMSQAQILVALTALIQPQANVTLSWDNFGANLAVLRMTSNTARAESVHARRAQSNDVAAKLLLGVLQGGIECVRFSNMRPVCTGSVYVGGNVYGDIAGGANGVNALANLAQGAGLTAMKLDTLPNINFLDLTTTVAADLWYHDATGGSDGVREKLQLIVAAINADANANQVVEAKLWGYHLAILRKKISVNTVTTVATVPLATPLAAVAGPATPMVDNVRRYTLGPVGGSTYQVVPGVKGLDGGVPGIGVPEYLGNQLNRTGFYALDGVDLFNLMVLPGDRDISETNYLKLIGPASNYCQAHRAFLIIDAPDSWANNHLLNTDASKVNIFRGLVDVKENAAVFYPKIYYTDRTTGLTKKIGPSGMIAGVMARTDSTRGVWKAPAGLDANLRGASDLDVILTDRENGILNPLAVNCLRRFAAGNVVWGARTVTGYDGSSDSDWEYTPIRRTALFLEESLYRGTQWVVFEPNDDPLWASIRKNLNAFMMGLFRQGAFQGSTPAQAFFVKCDAETTTQADRNLGIVNILVGFAPLKPAEFVVIHIQQIAGDL
jgi:phage tail sheath protein FI